MVVTTCAHINVYIRISWVCFEWITFHAYCICVCVCIQHFYFSLSLCSRTILQWPWITLFSSGRLTFLQKKKTWLYVYQYTNIVYNIFHFVVTSFMCVFFHFRSVNHVYYLVHCLPNVDFDQRMKSHTHNSNIPQYSTICRGFFRFFGNIPI